MQCANPLCSAASKYFRSGSLHCIDCIEQDPSVDGERRKVIWLCGECTMQFSVETWRPPGQQLRPRRARIANDFVVDGHHHPAQV
jgi:hypothetical protein